MPFMISRAECAAKGVHKDVMAGISGSAADGAYSICISSAYADDEDGGDTLYAYIPLILFVTHYRQHGQNLHWYR